MTKRSLWLCLALILGALFPLIFFSTSFSSQYRQFTETKGIVHFSFEYPADCKSQDHIRTNTGVQLNFDREVVKGGWADKDLLIDADKILVSVNPASYEPKTRLEETVSQITEGFNVVQTLERSSVTIGDGITGEQLVYSFDEGSSRMPMLDAPQKGRPKYGPLIQTGRSVYFNYGEFAWFIDMYSYTDEEQTKADFEHVLQTFKILN